MDQISLPMRIALAASLAFAAIWFVALKPKPVDLAVDEPLPAAQPAETKAQRAKASTPATTSAAAKASAPKVAAGKRASAPPAAKLTGGKAVMADVEAGRTVVLLFYHPSKASTDDQAVREAVKHIDRHGGKVRVHTASLGHLGQYEAITKGAQVTSTPTVLVIDRRAQARAIEGLTVTREIDAVVDRALKVK